MVDGGVTVYNNPAFLLFLMATVQPYNLGWPAGRERMLVVSVGTGTSPNADEDLTPQDMHLLYNAELTEDWLGRHGLAHIQPRHVQPLDSTEHMAELQAVGRTVARQVRAEHFAGF